jgi:hypothetical protein
MQPRSTAKEAAPSRTPSTTPTVDSVEQQVIAFAEQVGRIVGTVQTRAEGWLDRKMLTDQIAHVRDSATHLLERLSGGDKGNAPKALRVSDPNGRSGGLVDAPGKRHRKPAPSVKGAQPDSRTAKMRTVNAKRRLRQGQA